MKKGEETEAHGGMKCWDCDCDILVGMAWHDMVISDEIIEHSSCTEYFSFS